MGHPLRITFVLPTLDLSGGVRVISMLARELDEMGHRVLVVAGPPIRPPVRDRVRAAIRGDKHRWWSDPGKHHFAGVDVPVKRLASHRPVCDADLPEADAVVATWWETAEAVARLDDSRGARCYYAQHHEVHMEGQPHDRVNATYSLPLHLFACSGWVREQIEPFAGGSVPVVGYGMDRAVFDAAPRERSTPPTVGFMYSDVAFKGTEITLDAIERARAEIPDLRVRSFGSHPERPHLPLPGGCEHEVAPPQKRIAEIYGSCDAWLVGSHAEGYGLPLLESLACRTPLVSTRTGGAADLIRDGKNGYVVPVRDHRAMADAIVRVCARSGESWRALSDAAYETVRPLTWRRSAEAFLHQVARARDARASGVGS